MITITPEMLHEWYLEAIQQIDPENYNPKAVKPYSELTPQQRFIDKYIADKINTMNCKLYIHINPDMFEDEVG